MQFATHKTATPPLAGELIAQQIIILTNDFPFCNGKMKGNLGNRIENFVIFRDKSSIL
jgi:hypothetical protein